MKNFKKIVLCALSLLSSTAAFARENKEQIHLSNQYGREVLVELNWRMKAWPHTHRSTDLILKSNRNNFLLKAPISSYELYSIDVAPAVNVKSLHDIAKFGSTTSRMLGSTGDSIASSIARSLNNHRMHAHSHKYFVIKAEKHNSKVAGQKQITIHGHNEEEYNREIGNAPEVEVNNEPSEDYESIEDSALVIE